MASVIKATCALLKTPTGGIIGISLTADAETHSETFCASLPRKLSRKEGSINVQGGRVIFEANGKSASFAIGNEDATGLRSILGFPDLSVCEDAGGFTPGFKIVPNGAEREPVEEFKLEQI